MNIIDKLKIKIFADGANFEEFKLLSDNTLVQGFTTNPTLMKKQGIKDYEMFAKQILSEVKKKPISFEIFADETNSIIKQARLISSWAENVYVKVPVTNTKGEFLGEVIKTLSREGVKLNITAVFTNEQVREISTVLNKNTKAIISIFSGRVADTGVDPITHFRECSEKYRTENIEFLWASPRELYNIFNAEDAGADIITISLDLMNKLKNIGKDLTEYSKETVQMFYNDALTAGYKLDIN